MLIAYSFPNTVPFTTFTVTIIHLVYHPKFCLSIVFMLSWEDYNPPPPSYQNWKQCLRKTFGGEGGKQGVLWECESSELVQFHVRLKSNLTMAYL